MKEKEKKEPTPIGVCDYCKREILYGAYQKNGELFYHRRCVDEMTSSHSKRPYQHASKKK